MSQLVVVGFTNVEDARTAMKRLRGLEHAGRISFEDRRMSATRRAAQQKKVPPSVPCLADC
jgi:uncharacterized membrane protein